MEESYTNLTSFLLSITLLIMLLAGFILTILYLYRKKQISYQQALDNIKLEFEKNLLDSQLEIQEVTLDQISREIHDNISLSLTLAKLNLLTLEVKDDIKYYDKIISTIDLLSKSILDLKNLSKSLNSDTIEQKGLLEAIKYETERIQKIGLFHISTTITGNPEFMDAAKDLVIFRIIQESLNNIIKHSEAHNVKLNLHYNNNNIEITVVDDGIGFNPFQAKNSDGAGLQNIRKRAKALDGNVIISSQEGFGTEITITVPF